MQVVLWAAPPLGLALALLLVSAVFVRPGSPWVWCSLAFFVGHSLIGHKELRFLFPLLYAVPVLVAYSASAFDRILSVGLWRRVIVWPLAAQNLLLLAVLVTPAIHRGKEFDWHYFRTLWEVSERAEGAPVFVLHALEDPYAVRDLRANVYRHPSIVGIPLDPARRPAELVPPATPPGRPPFVTRTDPPPANRGPPRPRSGEAQPVRRIGHPPRHGPPSHRNAEILRDRNDAALGDARQ